MEESRDQEVNPEPVQSEQDNGWKKKTALFLGSQGLSMFGSMLVQYAIIWHITLTTQSGAVLTVATICSFLPQIAISIFAGVWADRYPRKILIIFADLLTATSTLALAILFFMGYQELWLMFLVAGIRSLGGGIQSPAVNALLPQIVPAEKLVRVNSINSTLQPFIMVTTPVLSGALLSFSRLESIFFIDVITAILAVSLLLNLKAPAHSKAAAAQAIGYLDDLKLGLGYIRRHSIIKSLFAFYAAAFFFISPVAFLSPLLVARSFGEEVWKLTANEVTFFVGSMIGGAIMAYWGGFKNHFRTIGLSCILWAVLFSGLGLTKVFAVYLTLMFLAGIPMPMLNVPSTSLLQKRVDQDMQGRVFGVMSLIISTAMPVGMLVFGPIADVISIETLLVLSSVALLIPGIWLFFNRNIDRAPLSRGAQGFELEAGD